MTLEERIKNALDKCALSGWRLSVLQTEIACVAQAAVEEERKRCASHADSIARTSALLPSNDPDRDGLRCARSIERLIKEGS